VSRIWGSLPKLALAAGLVVVVAWPALATVLEAAQAMVHPEAALPGSGNVLDMAGSAELLREPGPFVRPVRLALETMSLVLATEALALPIGVCLALLLFRTDVWARGPILALIAISAFIPLPLHATAWLGALGNAGRIQAIGVQPILVGRAGAAIVHALAALPWVVLIAGVGVCVVEPELEESALLDYGPWRVVARVTLRRSLGAIAAAALAVAVLTAGDMTVTDLLQIRTYAEEAYLQFSLGRGPGQAAMVALPPILVLGTLIAIVGRALARCDMARLPSVFARSRLWRLGPWRIPTGVFLAAVLGNVMALPLYSLLWRAGRVGGRAATGLRPAWSLAGLWGTMQFAAGESWEPLLASLLWTALAATLSATLAWALAWACRRSAAWRWAALATLALSLATPGPVAGMSLVLAYRDLPVIYDSAAMIVLAEGLRSLPYALLLLWPFLSAFPSEYLDAAALDGHGRLGQVFHVVLPLSRRALVAAWAVAFAIGLGELPATNLAAPPGTPPVSVVIWSLLHTGVESHLAGVALVMLGAVAAAGLAAAGAVRSLRALEAA
jgi:iron(III) transport system permease protein